MKFLSSTCSLCVKTLVGVIAPSLRPLSNMAETTHIAAINPVIGVCQMTNTANKEANFAICHALIKKAKLKGAQMVFLPEASDYIAESKEQSVDFAESLDGDLMTRYCQAAKEHGVWLSVGGFHQKASSNDLKQVYNTHVIIDDHGKIKATYEKIHLFDLDLKGQVRIYESDYTIPGQRIVSPVSTPVGKVALSVCYDLRFPELSLALAQQGADILTYPSAFTQTTGMAHWEVLLRARAIETQCYIVAAAQTGRHNEKRVSYGHAMIVDPWGCVIAQCREGTDVSIAEIDHSYATRIRQDMPVWSHRRNDLYPAVTALKSIPCDLDAQGDYKFGHKLLKASSVFACSALSFAFVNIKPVVRGHMLVASIRPVERFCDLTQAEVSDIFTLVQCVSKVVESQFSASSVTVAIQDGPDAGQTIKHVHVHILPRKPGDFERNDDIYTELQNHDKNITESSLGLRSEEEMAAEALMMRKAFGNSS